jgi:hypothetical protein
MLVKRILNIPPALEQFQGVMLSVFKQLSLPGLTRISLGLENSAEEIDVLLQALNQIARQQRDRQENPFRTTHTDVQKEMDDFARTAAQRVYIYSPMETTLI